MITEQQLKQDCTPELIKKMVGLAEGFECAMEDPNYLAIYFKGKEAIIDSPLVFSTLIHRAVEGWNKHCDDKGVIIISDDFITYYGNNSERHYDFETYNIGENTQVAPIILTLAECAMLDCLLEVLK